jgi:hypothetical protein
VHGLRRAGKLGYHYERGVVDTVHDNVDRNISSCALASNVDHLRLSAKDFSQIDVQSDLSNATVTGCYTPENHQVRSSARDLG